MGWRVNRESQIKSIFAPFHYEVLLAMPDDCEVLILFVIQSIATHIDQGNSNGRKGGDARTSDAALRHLGHNTPKFCNERQHCTIRLLYLYLVQFIPGACV